tara:strand:+ start:633 stop:806 length:174 start_codon:yes stop_codon:yes gene_type:complete
MSETQQIDIDPAKDAEAKKEFERLYDVHEKRKGKSKTPIQSILQPPSPSNTAQSNTA